jgi:CDP-glucose 4,6-dehydratase
MVARMTAPAPFAGCYAGKRVLLTGHTGFKGAWLCHWLCSLGADVTGVALEPSTSPALFDQLALKQRIDHRILDVRDRGALHALIQEARPDFVFHLAAQPLVRLSYETPVETYDVNVMGTVHLLDALRGADWPVAAVFITTDKCYENREWLYAYREEDPLGGYDPYSSSKAAAEIAIAAYRRSFFNPARSPTVKVASARAGNVIGGGDWALDRIIPDAMRALGRGEQIPVRNRFATRPWQHVLEPLSGYLWLAAVLAQPSLLGRESAAEWSGPFNFGPRLESNRPVAELISAVLAHWPGEWIDQSDPHAVHEAGLLNLATDKAHHLLGWQPVWRFEETIAQTVRWYRSVDNGADPLGLTEEQIAGYAARATELGIAWAAAE